MRLDLLLVEKGLCPTRTKAQAAVMAGKVLVDGKPAPKAGTPISPETHIEILPDAIPYVSRGGIKLAGALDAFNIDPSGHIAIDIGASTGGFTDCLLQRGAKKVYAVDVGHGQLDYKLREDPRVVHLEKTHIRDLRIEQLGPEDNRIDLAVVDVSFISLAKTLPFALPFLTKPSRIIALIKPQFELEPKKVPKGVVRDEKHRQEAVENIRKSAKKYGLIEEGIIDCPIKGPKGNHELLIYWTYA